MINALLTGIFKVITSLVNLILSPINTLITNSLPELSTAFSTIHTMFNILFSGLGWWKDALLLSSETISLMISCWTIKLTLPLTIYVIKLAIKWYDKLKP